MAIERPAAFELDIAEIQRQIDAAPEGSVVHLAAGRICGSLVIDKPIILRGAGADRTILDGQHRRPVLSIEAPEGEVHVEEVALTNGKGSHGGAISVDNGAKVFLVGCLLDRNTARTGRGGALAVDWGYVSVRECTIVNNLAALGGGIFVGGNAIVEVAASIIADNVAVRGGGVAVVDDGELELWTSRLEANQAEIEGHHLYTYGTTTASPRILLSNALLSGAGAVGLPISNHPRFKASIAVENSSLGRDKLPVTLRG